MNLLRRPYIFLPLVIGILSLVLFVPAIQIMETSRAWKPTLAVAIPAVFLALLSIILGSLVINKKPKGGTYGFAMTGAITGGVSMIFWVVMVPMLLIFALPAREQDSDQPLVEQSCEQMTIWVRHIKTFYRDKGRLPVKLEELIEKGYARENLLYDPRQKSKDAPSYRLMVNEMPPESEWATVPVIEGRIPNPIDGTRLIVYLNETCGTIDN